MSRSAEREVQINDRGDRLVTNRIWRNGAAAALFTGLAAGAACSTPTVGSTDLYDPGGGLDLTGNDTSDSGAGDGDDQNGEQELEASFRAPVVSGSYLWTANPQSDRVARIHATSLTVELFESGHGPTFLSALPQGATSGGALVLNELSQDASIFLTDDAGAVMPLDRIRVQKGASAWAVGKKGTYAIAWSKFGDSSLPGIDGHQDLTLFDFSAKNIKTTKLAVGYRPSEVFINQDETFAYVVCDPGISVISLHDLAIVREIFLPEGNLVGSRDIEFSPDGSLAISRTQGSADALLIDTETSQIKALTLPGVITDIDMSEDGSLAIAVVRGSEDEQMEMGGAGGVGGAAPDEGGSSLSIIALLDPEKVFDTPQFDRVDTEEIVGSVVISADASQAILYTNASNNTHLTILDPKKKTLRVVDVKAPARAAFMAEDGTFAVALMSPPPGSSKSGAFALVPVAKELPPRIEGTNNLPEYVSLSGKAQRALITTTENTAGQADTFFAQFPGLLVDKIHLSSRPLATGLVPDKEQGFVAQEHPEGRVTFVDLKSGQDKTVTGFELAAKVVD